MIDLGGSTYEKRNTRNLKLQKILNFYKKHKVAAILTILWFAFMVYITEDGIRVNQYTGSDIGAGIVAGIIMFVSGSLIIDIICVVLSKIYSVFTNILKIHKANSGTVEYRISQTGSNSDTAERRDIECVSKSTPQSSFTVNPYFANAGRIIIKEGTANINFLMEHFHIGLHQAIHIMGQLRKAGVIEPDFENPEPGIGKPSMTIQEFESFLAHTEFIKESLDYKDDIYYNSSPNNTPYDFDSMEGHQFEYFCADLLKHNDFYNVSVTQGSGDQGIDILAEKEGVLYGIQCKCYASDIGNKAVQEAFAGKTFYGCHVAAVLTNRHFTKSAIELAQVNKVLLWDREKLDSFIKNAK